MDKIIQHYVEKIYRSSFFNESKIEEVKKRDPALIKNDGKMQGFRFFNKNTIIDGEDIYNSENSDYSNWIFFGERLSLEDIIKKYPKDKILINNMKNNNYKYICRTQVGAFLPMQDGDSTYDEVLLQNKESKILTKEKSS